MYIPKGKLDPNIYYTDGNEYYLSSTRTEYKGYYHKDLFGNSWTGKEHTTDSIKLITGISSTLPPSNINLKNRTSGQYYQVSQKLKKPIITESNIPVSDTLPPTPEDYQKTYFTRYILQYKLSKSPIYIEVNKNTYYTVLSSSDALFYNTAEVLWKISGPIYDIKQNNILIQGGVIDSNKRSIQQAEKIIPGISNYLTDLLLYYN